jgi:predicted permease
LFGFALGVTGPTFLWVLCGVVVRRISWVTEGLIQAASLLVFRAGLPVILFFAAVRVDYSHIFLANYLQAGIVATIVVVIAASLYRRWRRFPLADGAIFVQGAYRSNLGVIGVALCAAAYGQDGLALAALPVAVMTILYNLIAVVLLNNAYGRGHSAATLLPGILGNPLIIGIGAGVMVSLSGAKVPLYLMNAGGVFTAGLLPVSLMCIGASLNLKALHAASMLTLETTVWKLLVAPLLGVVIAVAMGVHGAELGVLFLLLASPVAAASYIMVMASGGSGAMAANIVVVSTLFSSITLTLGLALLQFTGLV